MLPDMIFSHQPGLDCFVIEERVGIPIDFYHPGDDHHRISKEPEWIEQVGPGFKMLLNNCSANQVDFFVHRIKSINFPEAKWFNNKANY